MTGRHGDPHGERTLPGLYRTADRAKDHWKGGARKAEPDQHSGTQNEQTFATDNAHQPKPEGIEHGTDGHDWLGAEAVGRHAGK